MSQLALGEFMGVITKISIIIKNIKYFAPVPLWPLTLCSASKTQSSSYLSKTERNLIG